jgi:hypothetical protein
MYEDSKSKINQLEKILDSREDLVSKKLRRHDLKSRNITVAEEWDEGDLRDDSADDSSTQSHRMSFPLKLLIASLIFFIITIGLVAYNFIWGGNIVSGNNIEIAVKANVSIAGGETLPFEVEIKNNNNVTLTGADLGIVFPVGTKQLENTSAEAKRIQNFLGNIAPGHSVKKNFSVVMFGVEGETKDINITLEYKVQGSNSLFKKTKTVPVLISTSPVSIVVTSQKEVNTNQTVDFAVDITSNSPTIIRNLMLKAEYPFGFSLKSSSPNTLAQDNLWLIGDLEPGAKRTIRFSGTLSGQEAEERGFNFSLGSQSKSDNSLLEQALASSFTSVTIRRPFVSADITLNESKGAEYVSGAGEKISAVINWQNNLQYEVSDVSIVVKINGNSLDKSSIQVNGGYYRSLDNTIIFNKTTNSTFASLEPGQSGSSNFTFSSFGVNSVTGSSLINPVISLDVSVSGRRVDYENGQNNVLFSDARRVKITSAPQLSGKSLHYVGPFQNSGLIPPRAEKETTYTITWTVTNPLNNLSGAKVTAVLPPYIKWLGAVSPDRENISYDESTGTLVWSVGNITAGAGKLSPAREVSFQISFLPSVDQIGTSPVLVGESQLIAKDNFTLTTVSDSLSALTTNLNSDPYFKTDGGAVLP